MPYKTAKRQSQYQKKYYKNNRKKVLDRNRKRYSENDSLRKKIYEHSLTSKYGLTTKEYNEILEKQNQCCAICERHKSNFKLPLFVDHNHKTKKIRGLLCRDCNSKLGVVEQMQFLKKATEYLECNNAKISIRRT